MTLHLPRRGFIAGLVGIVAAPAVVKAESLMRISAPRVLKTLLVIQEASWGNLEIPGCISRQKALLSSLIAINEALKNPWDRFKNSPDFLIARPGFVWADLSATPAPPASPLTETASPPAGALSAPAGWPHTPPVTGSHDDGAPAPQRLP